MKAAALAVGPCRWKGMAEGETAMEKGSKPLLEKLEPYLGVWEHESSPWLVRCPPRRAVSQGVLSRRPSCLFFLPGPMGVSWRPLSAVPVPAAGGGRCMTQMNAMLHNLNENFFFSIFI